MNRMFFTLGVGVVIALVGFRGQVSAESIPYAYNPNLPVFEYHFPESSDNLAAGSVVDSSTAGNDATTYGFTTAGLSSNVPAGMTGSSIDCGTLTNVRGVRTLESGIWDAQTVAQYGGFVMDVWFYATNPSGAMQDIITADLNENIRIRSGKIHFNINNSTGSGVNIATSWNAESDKWYHVVAVFDTKGNEAVYGSDPQRPAYTGWYVPGDMYLYVGEEGGDMEEIGKWEGNSLTTLSDNKFEDTDRPIGIGIHPSNENRNFAGLIYDPKISFIVPEPSTLVLLATGLLGLICYAWRRRK